MKKRILSLFLALTLCLTLLPTSAFAEGGDVSISDGVIGGETGGEGGGVLVPPGGSTGEGGGIYTPPSGPAEGGGGTYIPEEDTRTEIWCVSKPDSIGRSYDGTTDGGTIPIDLTFTDGTNEIKLKEGTGFTAKKTFDSADAGWHTVTVEIELIGDAAAKYRLKAGEETFTIGGYIDGMLDGTIPPDKQQHYMQIVSAEVRRLSRLVRNMLDISRIQAMGVEESRMTRFDLSEVLGDVLINFEQKINGKGLNVDVELPDRPVPESEWPDED